MVIKMQWLLLISKGCIEIFWFKASLPVIEKVNNKLICLKNKNQNQLWKVDHSHIMTVFHNTMFTNKCVLGEHIMKGLMTAVVSSAQCLWPLAQDDLQVCLSGLQPPPLSDFSSAGRRLRPPWPRQRRHPAAVRGRPADLHIRSVRDSAASPPLETS